MIQHRVFSVFGRLAVVVYLALAVGAGAFLPAAFGPLDNWLSDLAGNDQEPDGARLYQHDGIVGGLGLAGFFLTFDDRCWGECTAVQTLAVLGCVFGTTIALTGPAVWLGAALPRRFTALCLAAWAFDIVSSIFGETRWLEWVVVAFVIAHVSSCSIIGLPVWGSGHSSARSRRERVACSVVRGAPLSVLGCPLPERVATAKDPRNEDLVTGIRAMSRKAERPARIPGFSIALADSPGHLVGGGLRLGRRYAHRGG